MKNKNLFLERLFRTWIVPVVSAEPEQISSLSWLANKIKAKAKRNVCSSKRSSIARCSSNGKSTVWKDRIKQI